MFGSIENTGRSCLFHSQIRLTGVAFHAGNHPNSRVAKSLFDYLSLPIVRAVAIWLDVVTLPLDRSGSFVSASFLSCVRGQVLPCSAPGFPKGEMPKRETDCEVRSP